MIKIHNKIWYVIRPDDDDQLAYMCQFQTDKNEQPLANVLKMQDTGRSWARVNSQKVYKLKEGSTTSCDYERDEKGNAIVDYMIPTKNGEEFIAENTPTTGFYVGCSVSRWSTSNKLFRVKDPRGFTVEIPTDNLATLLHHTTVVKGVVQEACVWGREGNNHILLPINSEPYLLTLDQMDTLENKLISVKDLKVGDYLKMFEDDSEYYYAGKLKGSWSLRGYVYGSYYSNRQTTYSEWCDAEDDKWTDVFLKKIGYTTTDGTKYRVETFSKPKIVEVIKNEPMTIKTEEWSWYCPERVKNKSKLYDRYSHIEYKLTEIKQK